MICTAPNIKGGFSGKYSEVSNCDALLEAYKYQKELIENPNDSQKKQLDQQKKEINLCNRQKAFINMEYATLIIYIILAVICAILGLFHFFETGKFFEKFTGLIGLISGVVPFDLTLVYLIYSGIVFTKDHKIDQTLLYDNGAYLKWDEAKQKYIEPYTTEDLDEDQYAKFPKFNELGKKQYNYDSKLFKDFLKGEIPFYSCCDDNDYNQFLADLLAGTATSNKYGSCYYIWEDRFLEERQELNNKRLYDTWITSLIFTTLTLVCSICLAVFGLLIFMNPDSSGHTKL